jgi:hypothetical protein
MSASRASGPSQMIWSVPALVEKLTYFRSGRDHRLTDVYGKVLREIVA